MGVNFRSTLLLQVAAAAAVAAFTVACAGGQPHPGQRASLLPAVAGLPPFPAGRGTAAALDLALTGVETFDRSSGVMEQGASLSLSGAAGTPAWAVYAFAVPAGATVLSVDCGLDNAATSAAWVGMADYARGHWVWFGPYGGAKLFPLTSGNHLSPGNNAYVAILAEPGQTGLVTAMTLSVDAYV